VCSPLLEASLRQRTFRYRYPESKTLTICGQKFIFFTLISSTYHRYLLTRLSLQVVYLRRHVSSTAPPFILWWSNLEILFGPLHRSSPFIGELRCQAIQMEQGLQYIVRCLWYVRISLLQNALQRRFVAHTTRI
jgi:hypothetical protein